MGMCHELAHQLLYSTNLHPFDQVPFGWPWYAEYVRYKAEGVEQKKRGEEKING
jgi:hypothetical protein